MSQALAEPLPKPGIVPVSATLASAAVAACVGLPGAELAIIAEATAERLATMPGHAAVGYAVDAATGAVFAPGAALPAGRTLFASLRIALAPTHGADEVLDLLAGLAGNGWRLERQPVLVPALDRSLGVIRARPADLAHPADTLPAGADGTGVVLGVVDFGCDFAHPAFLDAAGTTRLLFLWDQNATAPDAGPGAAVSPIPGRVRERTEIAAALEAADPYDALGYWPDRDCYAPAAARPAAPETLVHGTHVLGVAAGRGTNNVPAGVAPGASLAFVHLRPGALVTTGDPADVFDGVCAIFARADALGRPAVVNLSLGANLGSHDGNTVYDRALDALLSRPGRAIAVAAGNERQSRLNVDGIVTADAPVRLGWHFEPGDRTDNTIRIFCDAADGSPALDCALRQDGAALGGWSAGARNAAWLGPAAPSQAAVRGMIYSGLAQTPGPAPLQHIEIRFRPSGAAETVEITLSTRSRRPIRFDAWIDRQAASQSHFDLTEPLTRSTIVGTACGHRTVCVGAFDHRQPDYRAAPFSAEGLTRDERHKPDLCAPGLDILAAAAYGGRTRPGGGWQSPWVVRMSGTSAAAPHVAGLQALMLQRDPTLSAEDGARILRETSRLDPSYVDTEWHPQCGSGRVDAQAALQRVDAQAALQRVDAQAALQRVDAQAALQRVDAKAALQRVDAQAALQRVDAAAALQAMDAKAALERLGP